MSAAEAAVRAGRRAAEALMVDACTIEHRTTASALDETTGRVTRSATTVYTGPCRVQSAQAQPREVEVAGRTSTTQTLTVSIPVAAAGVRVNAVVTVTASLLDPSLVGRRFRVAGLLHKTHATAQRLQVEEVVA